VRHVDGPGSGRRTGSSEAQARRLPSIVAARGRATSRQFTRSLPVFRYFLFPGLSRQRRFTRPRQGRRCADRTRPLQGTLAAGSECRRCQERWLFCAVLAGDFLVLSDSTLSQAIREVGAALIAGM